MKTRLYFTLTLFIFITFAIVPLSFAQDARPIVKLIYFLPNDRPSQPDIDGKMDKLIKDVQQLYTDQMEAHGFGRKTFLFETDANGKAVVHRVTGRFTDKYYSGLSYTWDIWEEVENRFDMSRNYYFTAIDISSELIDGRVCGRGGAWGSVAGRVLIPASGNCFKTNTAAHEQEDEAGQTLASPLIVEIQDENGQPMQGVTVKFSIEAGTGKLNPTTTKTNADGNAQTTLTLGTPGTSIIRATATGIKTYVQFTATSTAAPNHLATDVNGDKVVDVTDLVLVAADFGAEPVPGALPDTDINDDGKINSEDVILVLEVLEGTTAAPSLDTQQTATSLQQWIAEAKKRNKGDATFQRGIAVLERLLTTLLPKQTALLANYPNPFNPETWIPYQLAKTAEVTLTIYAINGTVVRTLALGYQEAGHYQNRSRAAYWDGKNELGESVASGVYFYTFTAGEFSATRKMLIRK